MTKTTNDSTSTLDHRLGALPEAATHLLRRVLAIGLIGALSLSLGCGGDSDQPQELPEYDFPLSVEATDRNGEPVAGIPVKLDGQTIGFTDADGAFEAVLTEQPNNTIELAVDHTDAYRIVDEELAKEETLQITESLNGEYRGVPVMLQVNATTILKEHFVWIQTRCDDKLDDEYCADVPVLVDGEETTRTNQLGYAHLSLDSQPGTTHRIELDPPRPESDDDDDAIEIEPADPVFEFEFQPRPAVYHVDQEFTDENYEEPTRYYPPSGSGSSGSGSSSSGGSDSGSEDDCDTGGVISLDCL